MVKFLIPFSLLFSLTLVFVVILGVVAKRVHIFREGVSSYECGFDPKSSARVPFSLQFFLLGILFLMFDVEVGILLPMLLVHVEEGVLGSGSAILFLVILSGGFFHEWREGSLEWL